METFLGPAGKEEWKGQLAKYLEGSAAVRAQTMESNGSGNQGASEASWGWWRSSAAQVSSVSLSFTVEKQKAIDKTADHLGAENNSKSTG